MTITRSRGNVVGEDYAREIGRGVGKARKNERGEEMPTHRKSFSPQLKATNPPYLDIESLRHLLESAQIGKPYAFDKLYAYLYDRVYFGAYKFLQNDADAQECANDVLFSLWRNRFRIESSTATLAWVTTAVINRAKDYLRKNQRTKHISYLDDYAEGEVFTEVDTFAPRGDFLPCATLIEKEQHEKLVEVLDACQDKDIEVIILRFYQDLSVTDIAKLLGLKKSTVSMRLSRAIARMGALLSLEEMKQVVGDGHIPKTAKN